MIGLGVGGGLVLFLAGVLLPVFSGLGRAGRAVGAAQQWQASAMRQWQSSATGGAGPLRPVRGTAVVNSTRDTGRTVDGKPVVEIDLTVTVPGREPYRVKHRQLVSPDAMQHLQPGTTMTVAVAAHDPGTLTLG
ncbi:MAG TPA: hypothetical protein VF712_14055 [Thermoleophilaceae bacterium]|jgi:hypothetical protein